MTKYPIGIRVKIVADDFKGYGKQTRLVGQTGTISRWKPWKYGRKLPIIKLDSGELICDSKVWWNYE